MLALASRVEILREEGYHGFYARKKIRIWIDASAGKR